MPENVRQKENFSPLFAISYDILKFITREWFERWLSGTLLNKLDKELFKYFDCSTHLAKQIKKENF